MFPVHYYGRELLRFPFPTGLNISSTCFYKMTPFASYYTLRYDL